jgi:bacterioferritin-associated ferredoxin
MPVPEDRFRFSWNGAAVEAEPGDSIADTLARAGHRALACTRKRHRPLGLSGSFVQGCMARVDGIPNVRLDQRAAAPGLRVERQNAWPSPRLDLLRLLRFAPARLVRGGFEHPRWLPGGTRRFQAWERLLAFLAGEGTLSPAVGSPPIPAGRHLACDRLVVGGGPAGIAAANEAAAAGLAAVLVTRGAGLAQTAIAFGEPAPALDPRVDLRLGHEACAAYRGGQVLVAAPLADGPALAIDSRELVLATGKRSLPPLVPGNALPGVLEATTALHLAARAPAALSPALVVGTGLQERVAGRLRLLGVTVAGVAPLSALRAVRGRGAVAAAMLDRPVACRSVVHAGPWRSDPNLAFQAASDGVDRLRPGARPGPVQVVGAAAAPDEPVPFGGQPARGADVCPCMDVTAGEILDALAAGVGHVEELKRQTACGMGPCQGFPCWELMGAVVGSTLGAAAAADRPSQRGPRRAITVAQAAGLAGIVEPLQ